MFTIILIYACMESYDNYIWTNIATVGSKYSSLVVIKIKFYPFCIGASDHHY